MGTVLYNLMECIRISTILLSPFMPLVPGKVAEQTGQALEGRTWADGCQWGGVETGVKVCKKEAIFPGGRYDAVKIFINHSHSAADQISEVIGQIGIDAFYH